MQPDQTYSVFKSPPNFDECEIHALSVLVYDPKGAPDANPCPCCNRPIIRQRMSLSTSPSFLNFLGAQIPAILYYFKLLDMVAIYSICASAWASYYCQNYGDTEACKQVFLTFTIMGSQILVPIGFVGNPLPGMQEFGIQLGYILIFMVLEILIKADIFEKKLWNKNVADCSILLSNVPVAASEEDIIQFVRDRGATEGTVEVAIPKKMVFFKQILERKREVKERLYVAIKSNNYQKRQLLEMEKFEINQVLQTYKQREMQNPQKFRTGSAFVTLEYEEYRKQFLKHYKHNFWGQLWFRLFYCCSTTRMRNKHVIVSRAPPPRDIIWENLEANVITTRAYRVASTLLTFLLMIVFSLGTISFSKPNGTLLEGLLVSLFIQVTNYIIIQFVEFTAQQECHLTYTQTKVSLFQKMSLFLFLNLTLLPFLQFAYRIVMLNVDKSDALNQMISSLFFIGIGNLTKPIILLLNFGGLKKKFLQWQQRRKGIYCQLSQYEANKLWQPENFPIEAIYSVCLSSLLSAFFYLHLVPIYIASLYFTVFIMVPVSRYLLLRKCKVPQHFTSEMSDAVCKLSQLCVPLYFVGRALTAVLLTYTQDNNNFWSLLGDQFSNLNREIEWAVLLGYVLLVVVFDVDDSIAQYYVERKHREQARRILNPPAADPTQEQLLASRPVFNYRNANSFVRLMDQNPFQTFVGDAERQRYMGYAQMAESYRQ